MKLLNSQQIEVVAGGRSYSLIPVFMPIRIEPVINPVISPRPGPAPLPMPPIYIDDPKPIFTDM